MANPEHLKILKQGVKVWNEWREKCPSVEVDLRLEDLGSRSQFFDFGAVELANFLGGINFSGADLRGVNFKGTNLTGTDFTQATFAETIFVDSDLSSARGLESCRHMGPSVIDHRTLAQSGKLPLEFLRGCGLPDFIIDNIAALQGDPIQFYSCFISYSRHDSQFANRLYADLQNKGVRCWLDREDLRIGDRVRDVIEGSIRLHDKLLLILSDNSVQSEWVEDEVEAALEKERKLAEQQPEGSAETLQRPTVLFPVRIDEAIERNPPAWAKKVRRTRHIGDFRHWKDHDAYQKAFERLLRDLKQEAEKGDSPQAGLGIDRRVSRGNRRHPCEGR